MTVIVAERERRAVTRLDIVSLILEIPGRDDLCSDFVIASTALAVGWWMPGDHSRRVQVTRAYGHITVTEMSRHGPRVEFQVEPGIPGLDLVARVRDSIAWLTGDRADYRPRTPAKTVQDRPGRTDGGPDDCGHGETGGGL